LIIEIPLTHKGISAIIEIMENLYEFVTDGQLNIDAQTWKALNNKYQKDILIKALSNTIETLPFPYQEITVQDAREDFESLQALVTSELVSRGSWYSRYEYESELKNWYIVQSNIGRKASDFFFNKIRMEVDSLNSPSAMRSWTIEKFRIGFLKALWSLKMTEVNSKTLLTAIAMRKYIPSQFSPAVAKSIYSIFPSEKILDFSSGWGDRLVASGNSEYWGVDPNTKLHPLYKEMIKFHSLENKEMLCLPFEDASEFIPDNHFDLVFTSPPYFRVEKYSKEETQSYMRYRKIDEWVEKFLLKSISICKDKVKSGGVIAVNISDFYALHTVNKVCDPMVRHAVSIGLKYDGAIGMQMKKRPNSNASSDGVFAEPIWIFKKA